MPPPRKIDLIPQEIRLWLQEVLKERGFGDYLAVTEELNFKLEDAGLEMRVGNSAVHSQEYEQMAKAQEEASAWAVSWMEGNGLEEEAKRHNVLFQMITTLAFKVMKSAMLKEGDEIDLKELHFLGKMLKDVMSSSGIREKLTADERLRIAKEERANAAETAVKAAREAGMSSATAEKIKADILGVSNDG